MWPSRLSSGLALLAILATTSNALQVLSSSPCAVKCGNVLGSTSGDDLVCYDKSYGTSQGAVFEDCMNCLITSPYYTNATKTDAPDSDIRWLLYNLRYTISWCLFGYPNNTNAGSTPCSTTTACGPLSPALELDSLSPSVSSYSYCGLMVAKESFVPKCQACLGNQDGQFYLKNMLTVLDGACQQQPAPGNLISIAGDIFSPVTLNITDPSKAKTSSFSKSNGLSLGARVGIAISGFLLLLAIIGFGIVCIGKRRRRRALAAHQKKTGYANWIAGQQASNPQQPPSMFEANNAETAFHDSPMSQRPLVRGHPWGQPSSAIEESPASAFGEKAYFSPYSSQYSSPVSAHDQLQHTGRDWSTDRKGSIGGTMAGLGRSKSIEKRPVEEEEEGDRIELQSVQPAYNVAPMRNAAPVLLHPPNGRGAPGFSGGGI